MIHELLGTDALSGWTIPQLRRRLGATKYQVLAQIERERKQGFPICHTRHIWRRYYLADSLHSFDTFLKHYRAEVNRESRGLDACEKIYTSWKAKTKKKR